MSTIIIFVVILIIFIIVLIIIYSMNGFTPYKAPALTSATAISQYKIPSSWNAPTVSKDSQGLCKLYTFKGSNYRPAGPKFSSLPNCLSNNTCEVINKDQVCLDVDQIYSEKVSHVCETEKGPTGGTGCLKQDGTRARNGESEVYFRPCNTKAPSCGGTIAIIDLTFNPATFRSGDLSTTQCITVRDARVNTDPTVSSNIIGTPCDIGDINQILRIERFDLKPDGSLAINSSGLLARITHRQTGACLAPTLNPDPKGTYDPTNYNRTGNLSLVSCSIGNLSGAWWGLAAPTPAPNKSSTSPQQIVYIPDVTKIPKDLSNINAVWEFLKSTDAIKTNINNNDRVVMQRFNTGAAGTGSSDQANNQNNTQYIDYGLYDLIVNSGIANYQF
jgi:hypothetical protein